MNRVSAPRPHWTRIRGTWISLFAMLMIFIGPLISQSMPMEHKMGGMPMDMSMSMGMPEPAAHGNHHASEPGSAELHVLWEKCGYCSLFFHCPALPQALSLSGADLHRPSSPFTALVLQGHGRRAIFPGARTRAPPVIA